MLNSQKIGWKLVKRVDNDLAELIWRMADYGRRSKIETEKDWKVIEGLIDLFIARFRFEADEFLTTVKQIRNFKEGTKGYSKNREILHLASLPTRLQKLIKICFPMQQFDKKFMYKFIKRMPVFRVGGN